MTAQAFQSGFRSPKVNIHDFSMIPRADIPRSKFKMQHQVKTTINASQLVPVYLQEVLPGDTFNVQMTAFCRLATPLFPILDNADLESFFFFVPNRLVWVHWKQFMGEQNNPADSISFSIPQVVSPVSGWGQDTIYDQMGLPTTGQVAGGNTVSVNALPFRAYNLIWDEWFKDQNLDNGLLFGAAAATGYGGSAVMDDGPDPASNYSLQRVRKRHDYFTSCLPWTQKGAAGPVTIPLAGQATVKTNASALITSGAVPGLLSMTAANMATNPGAFLFGGGGTGGVTTYGSNAITAPVTSGIAPANLYADLTTATSTTINALRLAFQTQKLLERDARGGTRYTEIVRSHFGVTSPDARLQRPEYLGGGKTPLIVSAVPQTAQTGLTGGTTPLGTLGAIGTAQGHHSYNGSFTEHGYILGLVTVRTDQIYQQGLRKIWSRLTRYDFYFPVFAMLGEQAVLNKEIFVDGSANDALTFGFQERWAEYRYHPSFTSGFFRSSHATPLDAWHLATKFAALPALNSAFIQEPLDTTLQRNLALGAASVGQQLLCDFFFNETVARPMPMYSVPGLIDHF
jgi:hypothetical protein